MSIFDSKQGYWQKRKKEWKQIIHSENGRDENLLRGGLKELAQKHGVNLTGTSIFDPVLCEVLYNWFSPAKGIVFDPFAGGSVRGVIAEILNRRYIGIDLSQRQIDANRREGDRLGVYPAWYCDDSKNADKYIDDETADLIFSCPPYHNLEKYSNHPLDLSNMNYTDFITAYTDIITIACRKLKNDRFAVFVVGDIRNKQGFYRGFTDETKRIFEGVGLHLYNEGVLLEQYATSVMRAGLIFDAGHKLTKVHQNVLIFYKGNPKEIKNNYDNRFEWADLTKYKHG
jgi:DNA modification methylase